VSAVDTYVSDEVQDTAKRAVPNVRTAFRAVYAGLPLPS